jgi:hypothetical protein
VPASVDFSAAVQLALALSAVLFDEMFIRRYRSSV